MDIIIEKINNENISVINQFEDWFIVDSQLSLNFTGEEIDYTIKKIPSYKRPFPEEVEEVDIDYNGYIDKEDKTVYLAYINNQIVGQLVLRRNWNNYAYIEELKVDSNFRRLGIGKALLATAKAWTIEKDLPGIMLETQNDNVAACKFYEDNGFSIKGFDFNLYKGINKRTNEFALYWYYIT